MSSAPSSSTWAGPSTPASMTPATPRGNTDGFREDVLDLVRELGVTVVRYPGGNFVSGYRWEDGVGPPVARVPRRLNLAWHSTETNEFGLHEFVRWAARAGVEPMLAVNLGTRGVDEAVALLEYTNVPGRTTRSDERLANGSAAPFDIRMWCLGNEMDRPWQLRGQDRGRVRTGRRRDRTRDAHARTRPRAGRVRRLGGLDAHLHRVGADGPRARLRPRRLRVPARLLRGGRGR